MQQILVCSKNNAVGRAMLREGRRLRKDLLLSTQVLKRSTVHTSTSRTKSLRLSSKSSATSPTPTLPERSRRTLNGCGLSCCSTTPNVGVMLASTSLKRTSAGCYARFSTCANLCLKAPPKRSRSLGAPSRYRSTSGGTVPDELQCPHCDVQVFRKSKSGSRYKARTSILVLHKSGDVELNCPSCKRAIILPATFKTDNRQLRKAILTARKS